MRVGIKDMMDHMTLEEKLGILADSAKYDVSCSSSGSQRKNKDGFGNGHYSGICHTWSDDGRCVSLLKILMTNHCIYDCAYCINRSSNDIARATLTPHELAELTSNFYRRNYIEGLFLSSAIIINPNHTMELLTETAQKLREDYHFYGYIHMKGIPGADPLLIEKAGRLVDRMSVNIELPSAKSLKLLAPQKKEENIIKPMSFIKDKILEGRRKFVPAGQTTQLIVGATPETDLDILSLTSNLYKRYRLKRVYYSAYVPVNHSNLLPTIMKPPLLREHRLYQADWLLRFYDFKAEELLDAHNPNFDILLDPKANWALRNIHAFPLEVNTAPYEMLLRVPGIGVRSAKRILVARRARALEYEHLKKLGIVLKRAQYFITCRGKYYGNIPLDQRLITAKLTGQETGLLSPSPQQLSLFTDQVNAVPIAEQVKSLTGEL
jgi:putative DNA modification/repair radical SAM protein